MENIVDLKDERNHKLRSAQDIVNLAEKENRHLTEPEQKESQSLLVAADAIGERISGIQEAEKVAALVKEKNDLNYRPAPRVTAPVDPQNGPGASNAPIIPMRRCGQLQAFKGAKAEYHAYESGMWIIANLFHSGNPMKAKASRWCEDNGVNQQIRNALGTGVSVSGGALVPDAMSSTIIDLRETYGIGRQWADIFPMSSDLQIIPRRVGSPTASFAGENSGITESEPTFNNVQLTAKKIGILTRMSTELSEDAVINFADYLVRDMAWAFALKEDQCLFNGDGTQTYGGITGLMVAATQTGHSASYVQVPTLTHNTFQELDATDLTTLMASLPQYARSGGRGCAWFCSQYAADLCFGRLMASAGGNTNQTLAMAGITALGQRGVVGSYLGYPIVASQVLPSTASLTSKAMLAFGNLSMSTTIADRRTIAFAMDASRYFDQDQIAVRATERVDIVTHDLGDTSTAGPVVVLEGGTS